MRDKIRAKLAEIERQENVKVLFCVESGSRAWGFPSPDSDYDARFVYVRPKEDYLKLEGVRDVIEWQLDDVYDVSGWDLQKLLRLLHKSNPTIFEWAASPIVYWNTEEWKTAAEVIGEYFRPKPCLHHYMNMARSNHTAYLRGKDVVRIKKYFYILRPLMACLWIMDKGTPPPMEFDALCEAELDETVRPVVDELLARKKITSELGEQPPIPELNAWIDDKFEKVESYLKEADDSHRADWTKLNETFLKMLDT